MNTIDIQAVIDEVGFMGKTKEVVSLRLMGSQQNAMNEYDEYLYTVLEGAAGQDGLLQPKELERFANRNDTLLRTYIQKCDSTGRGYLSRKNCLKRWEIPARIVDLTPAGEKELGELMGFKRYLEETTSVEYGEVWMVPYATWKLPMRAKAITSILSLFCLMARNTTL